MSKLFTKCPKCKGTGEEKVRKNNTPMPGTYTICNQDCSLCFGRSFLPEIVAFEYNLKVSNSE